MRRAIAGIAGIYQQVLGDRHLRGLAGPRIRDIHVLKLWMIQDALRRLADWYVPEMLPGIHVDRSDTAVGRFEHIQVVRAPEAKSAQDREVRYRRACRLR